MCLVVCELLICFGQHMQLVVIQHTISVLVKLKDVNV